MEDTECQKALVAKLLGYLLILGSLTIKAPQVKLLLFQTILLFYEPSPLSILRFSRPDVKSQSLNKRRNNFRVQRCDAVDGEDIVTAANGLGSVGTGGIGKRKAGKSMLPDAVRFRNPWKDLVPDRGPPFVQGNAPLSTHGCQRISYKRRV